MTQSSKTRNTRAPGGGRKRGVQCSTNVKSGAYATVEQLANILQSWKKHSHGRYHRVQKLIERYLRYLGWDNKHPRLNEIRDLCIRTVSRDELIIRIIDKQYTRDIHDKITGRFVKSRPADQILMIEKLDDEIQMRLRKLGILKINGNE